MSITQSNPLTEVEWVNLLGFLSGFYWLDYISNLFSLW